MSGDARHTPPLCQAKRITARGSDLRIADWPHPTLYCNDSLRCDRPTEGRNPAAPDIGATTGGKELMRNKKWLITALAGAALFAGSVFAEEQTAPHVEFAPGFWLAGLSGDGTINGQPVKYNRTASDLLDHLRVGGSLAGKVVWNKFAIGGQLDGYSLSTRDLKGGGAPLNAKLDTDIVLSELAAGYTLNGRREGQTYTIALGVRYAHISNKLHMDAGESISRSHDQWDPILILWPTMPLLQKHIRGLSLTPAFSIGGGGDSELVYELYPQLRYQITEHITARIGYRSIGYRTKNGDNKLDFDLTGFTAGLGATF